jgi:hypothetical protein
MNIGHITSAHLGNVTMAQLASLFSGTLPRLFGLPRVTASYASRRG